MLWLKKTKKKNKNTNKYLFNVCFVGHKEALCYLYGL